MDVRPKLTVPLTPADKALEAVAITALVVLWSLTIWGLFRLPDSIPVHFNGAGLPDRYGEKGALLMLPLVATALFAVLTALGKFPHVLNYPGPITLTNALSQYRGALRLLRSLKAGIVLVFLLLVARTWQTATGQASGLGAWFLPFTLALLMGLPTAWYFFSLRKART